MQYGKGKKLLESETISPAIDISKIIGKENN